MSRVPMVEIEQMDERQRRQYDRFPSNLTRGLLLADPRLSEALPNLANALRASPLAAKLREAVIMRVAVLQDSAYEQMQHAAEVRKAGWSDGEVEAIKAGDGQGLPEEVAAVMDFVDQAVVSGQVSDAVFVRVQASLTPNDIATLILLIGHYMMIARFTAILRIELDAEPDGWAHEH